MLGIGKQANGDWLIQRHTAETAHMPPWVYHAGTVGAIRGTWEHAAEFARLCIESWNQRGEAKK